MSCKTLKDCPSLLTSIDEADPNNIFDFLTPCKAKNANDHKENDQDQNPDITFVCFQPVFDPWDLAAEMSNCNCKPLPQCPNLMEKFVATQNWTGLKQIQQSLEVYDTQTVRIRSIRMIFLLPKIRSVRMSLKVYEFLEHFFLISRIF